MLCQNLSSIVKFYQVVPNCVKFNLIVLLEVLSSFVKFCQMASGGVKWHQVASSDIKLFVKFFK